MPRAITRPAHGILGHALDDPARIPPAGEGRLLVVSNRLPLSVKKTAGRPLAQRADVGRPAERDGPDPQAPGRGLDRLARLRAAHQRRGLGRADRALEAGPRLRGRRPARRTSPASSTRATRTRRCGRCSTRSRRASTTTPSSGRPTSPPTAASATPCSSSSRPATRVWIHDYHLMLLPRMLREVAPETRIGFFLHIPFPASELLRILPRRDEVLRGLLGADLLAFQTHADLQHFRASLLRLIGLPSQMDRVVAQGHSTRLEALPISIAPEEFTDVLEHDEATQAGARRAARAIPGAAHPPRRRPPGLHQGHSPAAARLPQAAGGRAEAAGQGHPGPGRGPVAGAHPRVRAAAPRGERPRGRGQRRVRPDGLDAHRLHAPRHQPQRAGGAVRGGGRRLGHPAAGRDEPRGQGIRRLPPRSGRRAAAERVRGGGGGDGRGVPREPLRRGAHGVGPGADPRAARSRSGRTAWRSCTAASSATTCSAGRIASS